jgi:predicted outer membrane repeat protein
LQRSFLDNAVHWVEAEESANHSPPPLAGDTPIYVDVNTTASRPNGKTWSKAFPTIQEGIEAAYRRRIAGVWVADGVYAEERREEDGALVMRPGVHIYGGFAGDEDLREQRDWEAHATVIDGARSRNGSAAYHVVVGANQATLDGFTISGGNANGPIYGVHGGGMFNDEVSPEVRNCLFQGNTAESSGGGIYWTEANALITHCRFEGNQAESGGAFHASESDLVFTDCRFEANISTGMGAGLYLREVTAVIADCMFEANQAGFRAVIFSSDSDLEIRDSQFLQNEGGAVDILSGGSHLITGCRFEGNRTKHSSAVDCNEATLELTHCDFVENFAENLGGAVGVSDMTAATIAYCTFRGNESNAAGGAVYISSSNTTVSHCEFDGNTAQSGGGALALWGGGDPRIEHSVFRGNEAENGGAVHLREATPHISDSLFVNNTARGYGGVLVATEGGTASLVHCTLVDNHAERFGVAATRDGAAGAVTFTNSILWDNGTSPLDQGVEVRYSNVQGGAPGSTNLDADPRFVDPSVGDYRLLPDSPSIDAGVAEGEASDDLDGQARPQGRAVDLGAYEFVFK